MNKISLLDCTLRDGGYCNNWEFGYKNILKIINSLNNSEIEIIECGFLSNKHVHTNNSTIFNSVEEIYKLLHFNNQSNTIYVAMINFGEYDINDLPVIDDSLNFGIRVTFHKKDATAALIFCNQLKDKGYKVFVQAMLSLSYSDSEFLELISNVNSLSPYAFYIVDSFGMMKRKNLMRFFYLLENNLKSDISIGFHSHNNMQLAYSNAVSLVDLPTNRDLIIDSSIYGMGRGAGNLNTELFIEYLNENRNSNYKIEPLLNVIDEILNHFFELNNWGYSLPNYISAKHWAHPNYASFLSNKNTLTIEAMNEIFSLMDENKKFYYDKSYIENLYFNYMNSGKNNEENISKLRSIVLNKKILLIAPGKSCKENLNLITDFISKNDVIVVSINFDYKLADTDYVFFSNLRRYRDLETNLNNKLIATSNIPVNDYFIKTNYFSLLSESSVVKDNSGLMAIKFFMGFSIDGIYLAGFDGYSHDFSENYALQDMIMYTKRAIADAQNNDMCQEIAKLRNSVNIKFITPEIYIH